MGWTCVAMYVCEFKVCKLQLTNLINDISVCKERGTFIINKNIHNEHSASHEQLHRHTQQTYTQTSQTLTSY